MTHIRFLLLALLVVALAAPATAGAATTTQILRDCALDGKLDGKYSAKELRAARKALPTDSDEYSDCRDQLRDAERRAAAGNNTSDGGGGGGGGGGGTTGGAGGGAGGGGTTGGVAGGVGSAGAGAVPGTFGSDDPAVAVGDRPSIQFAGTEGERKRLDAVRAKAGDGVALNGRTVRPNTAGINAASLTNDLPTPLIAMLAALAGALLALAAPQLRRRVLPAALALPRLRHWRPSVLRRGGD